MTLTFDEGEDIFRLDIREGKVLVPYTGYRKGQNILLSPAAFKEWIDALKADDFLKLKSIIENVIDFESYQLACDPQRKMLSDIILS